ncbi:MAG: MFS transporter [Spirochaetales bacterium]
MDAHTEKQKLASGRNMSVAEGFIQTIGINMGGVYLPNFILTAFLLEVMHASHALIGLATSVQFFVGLLQPLANIFVHKVRSRRLVAAIAGTVSRLLFVSAIFYGMANSGPGAETVFMVILVLGALLMAAASSTWSTWIADLVPESIRGRYFALRNSIASVAGIIAVLVGGWLLKTFPGTEGYVVVYSIAIVTAVIGGILVLLQYEPAQAEQPQGSMWSSYKEILKDRNFMAFVRMVLFFNLALVIAGPFFTVHFLEVLRLPIDQLAYLTAGAAVAGILGNFFFGKMSDILGNRFIIRFSLLMLMVPTALMLFIPARNPLPMVAAVILLQAFFGAGWGLATFNTSLSISPRGKRALYIGVYNSLNSVSAVAAPILGGFLIDLYKNNHIPVLGFVFPPTYVVFAISFVLLLVGLITFPFYSEGSRHEDYSLRDVVFRMNFPEILYRLFVSTFMPRISSRHRLTEDIADLRSPAAVKPLERLLDDMDPEVRMSALEGLGKTGSDDAVEALLHYHPRAGVLEKVELLKAFKAFSADPRVKAILLEETRSPLLTRRLRALRSLGPAASEPEVASLALAQLQGIGAGNLELDEEEYLAWVELCVLAKEWDVLGHTLPRYPLLSFPAGRRGLLFHWSTLFDFRDDFYRYLSYETPDDREAIRDELRASSMEALARSKTVSEIRHSLKTQAKVQGTHALEYFRTMEKALFHALKPWNASVQALVKALLHQPALTEEEEVFLLMTIKKLLE